MGLLDFLGFGKKKEKMKEFLNRGAIIVDVRSRNEFQGGHVKGSENLPLDTIDNKIDYLKGKKKPIIFCCASGMRSGIATGKAKSAGIEAMNGGGWMSVNGAVNS